MKIKVLESNDQVKLEVDDLTFIHLVNERIWNQKIDYAAYARDHPYLSKPVLVVKSKDPKKALVDASQQIIDEVTDLRKKFNKAIKE